MSVFPSRAPRIAAAAMLAALAAGPALAGEADDRAQIENLMARYAFAMDWRDGETYASTFTEDAVLDSAAGVERGRDAIRAAFDASTRARETDPDRVRFQHRHSVTNILIEVDGDTATARAYWTALRTLEGADAPEVWNYGHYEDELRRVDGAWLFSRRVVRNEQSGGRAAGAANPAR